MTMMPMLNRAESSGARIEVTEDSSKPLKGCLSSGSLKGLDQPSGMRRRISFGKLEIREYEREIGGNICGMGVPVTLGWEHRSVGQLDVEDYEKHKQPRTMDELRLPSHVRMDLMKQAGFSLAERLEATKEATIERNRRQATANATPEIGKAEEILEKTGRKLRRALRRRSSKKKENEEIAALILRDRARALKSQQMRRITSCPTLDQDMNPVCLSNSLDNSSEEQLRVRKSVTEGTWLSSSEELDGSDDWFIGVGED